MVLRHREILFGAALVLYGLYDFYNYHLTAGVVLIFFGRIADILDGIVAEYTKTKSPLGEAIDATIDKVLIILALVILINKDLLPLFVGVVMSVHAAYMIVLAAVARFLKTSFHPSSEGKMGATFEWLCIGLYLISDILKQQHHTTTIVHWAAAVSFGLFAIAAVWSGLNYARVVYYKRVMGS